MIRLVVCVVLVSTVSSVFSQPDDVLVERFKNFEALFEESADLFASTEVDVPSLNHIDREGYSPRSLDLKSETLNRQRELLRTLNLQSVMKGDFSGLNLADTVYLLAEEEAVELDEFYSIQRGYVRTNGLIGPLVETFGISKKAEYIEFIPLAGNWYLYERRYNQELISCGPFILDR